MKKEREIVLEKSQRTISIGIKKFAEYQEFFNEHSTELANLEINSVPKLIRVLANFGKKPLLKFLEDNY